MIESNLSFFLTSIISPHGSTIKIVQCFWGSWGEQVHHLAAHGITLGRGKLIQRVSVNWKTCKGSWRFFLQVCLPAIWVMPQFSSVQSLSHIQHFVTPWTAAYWASLSLTKYQSLLKLMSIESMMSSNHLTLCCPLLLLPSIFSSIRVFSKSQFFASGGQSIGTSASASALPMHIQGWFSLGWTGLISLQSKGLSRVFSNTTVQKHQFFSAQISL